MEADPPKSASNHGVFSCSPGNSDEFSRSTQDLRRELKSVAVAAVYAQTKGALGRAAGHVGVRGESLSRGREDLHGELIWHFNRSFEFACHSSNIPRIDPCLMANFREFVASLRATFGESRKRPIPR